MSFSLIFSVGSWGGVYGSWGKIQKRLCLGWFAFTFMTPEYDEIIGPIAEKYGKGDPDE